MSTTSLLIDLFIRNDSPIGYGMPYEVIDRSAEGPVKIAERPKSERSDGRIPDISNYHPDPRTGPPVAFRLPFETLSRATSRAGERHAERGETVGSWLTSGGAAGVELEGGAGGGTVAGGPGPRGRTPRALLQPVQGPRAAGPRGSGDPDETWGIISPERIARISWACCILCHHCGDSQVRTYRLPINATVEPLFSDAL